MVSLNKLQPVLVHMCDRTATLRTGHGLLIKCCITPDDKINSVLGPLLFLVYIDGLTGLQLKGGSLTMFADDLLLHKVVH